MNFQWFWTILETHADEKLWRSYSTQAIWVENFFSETQQFQPRYVHIEDPKSLCMWLILPQLHRKALRLLKVNNEIEKENKSHTQQQQQAKENCIPIIKKNEQVVAKNMSILAQYRKNKSNDNENA
jgi:hypothetical protein